MGAKGLLTAGFGTIPEHLDMMALREEFLRYYQEKICVNTSLYQGVTALYWTIGTKRDPLGDHDQQARIPDRHAAPFLS